MGRPPSSSGTAGTTGAAGTASWRFAVPATVLAAVIAGLGIAAVYRQGAFFPLNATLVALVALPAALMCLAIGPRPSARVIAFLIATALFAAWWMTSAAIHHEPKMFLPLGAGAIAFAAAFVVARGLPSTERPLAAAITLGVGALSGGAALVAVLFRWFPLAIPSQHLWRLATTLTYSNAAGALLALSLLIGLSLNPEQNFVRVGLFLCTCSLIATQSRGAILGVAIALALIPWAQLKRTGRTLVLGGAAGLFTVALSPGKAGHPVGLVVLAGLTVVAGTLRPGAPRRADANGADSRARTRATLIAVAGVLLALVAAATVLHTPIERRLQLASTEDRGVEWSAAFAQWQSSPFIGTGPDQTLHFVAVDGNTAHFAHNEYLQVLAGSGVIGEVLLLGLVVTVARAVTRKDLIATCGCAALLAFAISGSLDFDWHLPALCLWAGWAGGLAGPPGLSERELSATPPAGGIALPETG